MFPNQQTTFFFEDVIFGLPGFFFPSGADSQLVLVVFFSENMTNVEWPYKRGRIIKDYTGWDFRMWPFAY